MLTLLIWFSAVAFLIYGASCVCTARMAAEFERYGLAKYRIVTGTLQLLGGAGLLLGLIAPLVGLVAAGGLTLQMLLGFGVRLKIRDSLLLASPAFSFMILNGWICYGFYQSLSQ
ncbi:MAG: DoxX family protein [Verrucomicrobiales bacterium]|nr:DoxX family protein [Verrucomicrobiales bacterium]